MKRRILLLMTFCCVLPLFAAKPKYASTVGDMEIAVADRAVMALTHYGREDMAGWNVLVLDTENTKRTREWLDEAQVSYAKYKKVLGDAGLNDSDPEALFAKQNAAIESCFKSVSYTAKAGETYDIVVLRDYVITQGAVSGAKTESSLLLWFVYPASDTVRLPGGKSYLYRGRYEASGYGVIPKPANQLSITPGTEECVNTIATLFAGGVDLYTLGTQQNEVSDGTVSTETTAVTP